MTNETADADYVTLRVKRIDLATIERIESALGCHRGWHSSHAYFDHSGGMVTLGQASGVWDCAMEIINIIKRSKAPAAD